MLVSILFIAFALYGASARAPAICTVTFENKGAFVLDITQEDVGAVEGVRRQAELSKQSQDELRREEDMEKENEQEQGREESRRRQGMSVEEETDELNREENLVRDREQELRREETLIEERQEEARRRTNVELDSSRAYSPKWTFDLLAGQTRAQEVHFQYPVKLSARLGKSKTCNLQEFCGTKFTCWGTIFDLECDC